MSESWIKMRTSLATNPKVVSMAVDIGVHVSSVIGACFVLWSIADQHSINGRLPGYTPETLDAMCGLKGFCAAAQRESVKWIQVDDRCITLPRFGAHNGNSAKRRAAKAKSEAKNRNNRGHRVDNAVHVSDTKRPPRLDKREIRKTAAAEASNPVAGAGAVDLDEATIQARSAALAERPSWLPPGKRWITAAECDRLARLPLTAEQVEAAMREGRECRQLENPAGVVIKALRAAAGDAGGAA